jgi:hypothetical protein
MVRDVKFKSELIPLPQLWQALASEGLRQPDLYCPLLQRTVLLFTNAKPGGITGGKSQHQRRSTCYPQPCEIVINPAVGHGCIYDFNFLQNVHNTIPMHALCVLSLWEGYFPNPSQTHPSGGAHVPMLPVHMCQTHMQ